MRQWTPEERMRQAELIKTWQPWNNLPPKSAKAKSASRRNALKHGAYSREVKEMRRYLKECRARLKALKPMPHPGKPMTEP